MTALVWDEAPISKRHDRASFDCGDADLNLYLQKFARQNHESGGAKCFVAVLAAAPTRVLGFYTLSPASIDYARTPALAKKGLARYDVPVFRLGRLAVDRTVQGRELGGVLLLRAADRCIRVAQDVGGVALLIDAKNERAARWYQDLWRSRSRRRLPLARAAARRRGRCDRARNLTRLLHLRAAGLTLDGLAAGAREVVVAEGRELAGLQMRATNPELVFAAPLRNLAKPADFEASARVSVVALTGPVLQPKVFQPRGYIDFVAVKWLIIGFTFFSFSEKRRVHGLAYQC